MAEAPTAHSLHRPGTGFFSRDAIRGVPWMVASKLALFFIYTGVSVITVGALGRERYGVLSLVRNISDYLTVLCGLGLTAALMRYIPELAARRNRPGLLHMLWKSAALQAAATAAAAAALFAAASPLQRLFNMEGVLHFRSYLMLACALIAMLLLRDYVATVFTALFRTKIVAALTLAHGVAWIVALALWLRYKPGVGTVLLAQVAAGGLVGGVGAALLVRHVLGLPWTVSERGIGRRRTLAFSGSVMLSSTIRMMMYKYTEVFFLASVSAPALVGSYDLGYTLPSLVITFLPSSVLALFNAGFAEAYVKDPGCLGRLVESFYKLLILMSLPVTALGLFFSPVTYHIVYNGRMDEAGYIASAFCVVLTLPLVSMPLSMAIRAKEKVMQTIPLQLLQIAVNLFLDWLLIVDLRMGAAGGILAVLGTFLLTIPFRLSVVHRIIGGNFFPLHYFLRIAAVLFGEAGALYAAARLTGLFSIFESNWANLALLLGLGAIYLLLFALLVRLLRLVRPEDVREFQALEIGPLNKVLRFFVPAG